MDDFLLSALFLTSTIIRFSSDKNEVISDRGDQALNGRSLLCLAEFLMFSGSTQVCVGRVGRQVWF